MVGAARRVETRVVPVAKVTVYPGWHLSLDSLCSFVRDGADEGFQEELRFLLLRDVAALREGWNYIIALLIIVVAMKVGYLGEVTGCRGGQVFGNTEDCLVVDHGIEGRRGANWASAWAGSNFGCRRGDCFEGLCAHASESGLRGV
jgi:hypothetical protein